MNKNSQTFCNSKDKTNSMKNKKQSKMISAFSVEFIKTISMAFFYFQAIIGHTFQSKCISIKNHHWIALNFYVVKWLENVRVNTNKKSWKLKSNSTVVTKSVLDQSNKVFTHRINEPHKNIFFRLECYITSHDERKSCENHNLFPYSLQYQFPRWFWPSTTCKTMNDVIWEINQVYHNFVTISLVWIVLMNSEDCPWMK